MRRNLLIGSLLVASCLIGRNATAQQGQAVDLAALQAIRNAQAAQVTPNVGGSSSSTPKRAGETDSFDLKTAPATGASVHGDANGPVFRSRESAKPEATVEPSEPVDNPGSEVDVVDGDERHTVVRGDTLWGISGHYFRNPHHWPIVWSFNPQIKNPHWIYPGERVNLLAADEKAGANKNAAQAAESKADSAAPSANAQGNNSTKLLTNRNENAIDPNTIFIRDQGFISDSDVGDYGELVGSNVERAILVDGDSAYVRVSKGVSVKIGEELTIFRPLRKTPEGNVVEIQGTLRVNYWEPRDRIARGVVLETTDTIERGARVGLIGPRFDSVVPVKNTTDLSAKIIGSIYRREFYGQNMVVVIDKGFDDGLRQGNTLQVMGQGDAWRNTIVASQAARRMSTEGNDLVQIETVPAASDADKFPEYQIAEARVLTTRQHTATCLILESLREIEPNQRMIARKGY